MTGRLTWVEATTESGNRIASRNGRALDVYRKLIPCPGAAPATRRQLIGVQVHSRQQTLGFVYGTITYDTRQRVTSRSTAGETTSFTYYPTGLLRTITLPDSSTLKELQESCARWKLRKGAVDDEAD